MDEIWDHVFSFVLSDSMAAIRLLLAKRHLYFEYKYNHAFWTVVEAGLPHQHHYASYKAVNKHLGLRRRVVSWAKYCDSRCSKCKCDLFGHTTGTFALMVKLCYGCKSRELISEPEIQRYLPAAMPLVHARLKYCWVPWGSRHIPTRHYRRSEVLPLLEIISFF